VNLLTPEEIKTLVERARLGFPSTMAEIKGMRLAATNGDTDALENINRIIAYLQRNPYQVSDGQVLVDASPQPWEITPARSAPARATIDCPVAGCFAQARYEAVVPARYRHVCRMCYRDLSPKEQESFKELPS